jgi:hypothetical protein
MFTRLHLNQQLGVVASVISRYKGGRDKEDWGSRPAQVKSVSNFHSPGKKLGMVAGTCLSSIVEEQNRRIVVQASLGKK